MTRLPDKSQVMPSLIFAEIRKILWKCYLLNMLSAWRFNPWHGSNTFCCHVDAFCYLISDQVATTCYLQKQLVSNTEVFIVPKHNGKFRPVINLRYFNEFVHYDHFKQETFKIVLDLLQENDFLTSVNFKMHIFQSLSMSKIKSI